MTNDNRAFSPPRCRVSTVTAGAGITIRITIVRIVSLLSSSTEMLFGLGLGEQVVAVSHECDYPPPALHLPRATRSLVDSSRGSRQIDEQVQSLVAAGGALYEIDGELLVRLAPDLIVTQAQCDVCAVRYQDVLDLVAAEPRLQNTRVLALSPTSLADILDDIQGIADAADASAAGRRYVAELQRRIDSVRQASQALARRPRVVCLEWLDPLMTAGNWTPELIALAGGESCLATAGRHSGYTEWSAVTQCNPDVLLIAPCGFDLTRSQAEARQLWSLPGFAELTAVKRGRAYVLDGNAYLNRSGPRIVDTLEILADLFRGAAKQETGAWQPLNAD
jgi:iron complex transport system substrate-binding protein